MVTDPSVGDLCEPQELVRESQAVSITCCSILGTHTFRAFSAQAPQSSIATRDFNESVKPSNSARQDSPLESIRANVSHPFHHVPVIMSDQRGFSYEPREHDDGNPRKAARNRRPGLGQHLSNSPKLPWESFPTYPLDDSGAVHTAHSNEIPGRLAISIGRQSIATSYMLSP
jgi:hypothetical protein